MTEKLPHRNRANPTRLPVSPKRGLAATASSYGQRQPSPDVEGMTDGFKNVTTASDGTSSSPSSQSDRRTRSSNPTTFSSLPSAEEIRNRRAWTVARTLSTSEDGSKITVQWRDTVVPHKSISLDKDQRAFVRADGMKHYIAKRSKGGVDSTGRAMWNVKWEPSTIPKEWMEDLEVEENEDSEEGEGSPALSESEHGSIASDSSDYSSGPDTPSSSGAETNSGTDSDTESEAELAPSPSPTTSSEAESSPSPPSSPPQLPSLDSSPSKPRQSIESPGEAQQAKEDPTTSLATFAHLPKAYIESLHFPVRSDKEDYGPAVRKLIAAKAGNELSTSTNAVPQVIRPRLGKEPVRPLQFKKRTVNRVGHSINLKDTQNAEAVLVHMQGREVTVPCRLCAKERGVMQGCVVMEGFGKGECTNCHYGGSSRRCWFRQDTSDPDGYRQAEVAEYQATSNASQTNQPTRAVSDEENAAGAGEMTEYDAASSSPFHLTTRGKHDFVSDRERYRSGAFGGASSSSSDEFVMSGGLGKLTVTPTPTTKTALSRSRSRGIDTSEDDTIPATKKSKIATPGLSTSPDTAETSANRTKSSKKQKGETTKAQKKDERERRQTTYSPPSSPPLPPTRPQKRPKPAPTFKPLKPLQEPDQIVAQQRLPGTTVDQCATTAAKSTTSGAAATSSTARLTQRKQQAAPATTDLPSSLDKKAPATAKSNGLGSTATSSAEPPKDWKQQAIDNAAEPTLQSSKYFADSTLPSKSDEAESTPVSTSARTSSAVPKPAANAPTSHPDASKRQAPARPTPSSPSTSHASIPPASGSTSTPDAEVSELLSALNLPALAIELNYNKRAIAAHELAKTVAEGESRERDARDRRKAARRKERQKKKNEKIKAQKREGERGPLRPVTNGSIIKPAQREKPAKQFVIAPSKPTQPGEPTEQPVIAPSKPVQPRKRTEPASTAPAKPPNLLQPAAYHTARPQPPIHIPLPRPCAPIPTPSIHTSIPSHPFTIQPHLPPLPCRPAGQDVPAPALGVV